jgi:hypothetical protein
VLSIRHNDYIENPLTAEIIESTSAKSDVPADINNGIPAPAGAPVLPDAPVLAEAPVLPGAASHLNEAIPASASAPSRLVSGVNEAIPASASAPSRLVSGVNDIIPASASESVESIEFTSTAAQEAAAMADALSRLL